MSYPLLSTEWIERYLEFEGSLLKALRHFDGLEAALHQFGAVPTDEWSR